MRCKSPLKQKPLEPKVGKPPKAKIQRSITLDHTYVTDDQVVHKKLDRKVVQLKRRVNALAKRVERRNKRIKCMKDLLKCLKEKQLVADKQHLSLTENFGSTAKCVFENQVKNTKKDNPYAQ